MMSRCEYNRRFVAVRLGTTSPRCSYIISVRVCVARISAVIPIVYSGLSRFSTFTALLVAAARVTSPSRARAPSSDPRPAGEMLVARTVGTVRSQHRLIIEAGEVEPPAVLPLRQGSRGTVDEVGRRDAEL